MVTKITRKICKSGVRDLLKKLTLVMLTYNRQSFALRNMRYWSGKGVKLIVIDGSEFPINSASMDNLDGNIFYYHKMTTFVERLNFACDLIDTEYASLISDDEFYLPTGLASSIHELELDSSLVACMGRPVAFKQSSDGSCLDGMEVYPKHASYEITGETSAARLLDHMDRYAMSTLWSVVRSDVFIKSHAAYLRKQFPVFAIWELQFELSVSYFGKSKIIPVLHWLRSMENPSVEIVNSEFDRGNLFHIFWTTKEEQRFRTDFLEVTSEVLVESDGRDRAEVANEIECAINAYILTMQTANTVGHLEKTKRKIKSYIPPSLKIFLKYVLNPFFRFDWDRPLITVARELSHTGVNVDFNELLEIEDIVTSFHSAKI